MRFVPVLLFLGLLFNFVCVIVFRIRLDRKYFDQLQDYKAVLSSEVRALSADALTAIDGYFVSNYHASASFPASALSKSRTFTDSGDWLFNYFEQDNIRYARVGFRNYREGDIFPRGGIITSIHPDGVLVDGEYWFRNIPSSSRPISTTTTTTIRNGGLKNERGTNSGG